MAGSYAATGNIEQAIKYYERALEITPRFPMALLNLSVIYFKQAAYEQAFDTFIKIKLFKGPYSKNFQNAFHVICGWKIRQQIDRMNSSHQQTILNLIYDRDKFFKIYLESKKNNDIFVDKVIRNTINDEKGI